MTPPKWRWCLPVACLLLCGQAVPPTERHAVGMEVGRTVEITLRSNRRYAHPQEDVAVYARIDGPEGRRLSIAGFWDGGDLWRVRFRPDRAGTWSWEAYSSDEFNQGLHGRSGQVEIVPSHEEDRFAIHGPLRVADSGRTLEHEDGTPFFYLADTAWEMSWKSTPDEVLQYLDDRRKKGFTAVQISIMSHQELHPHGIRNRAGEPFFLDDDYSRVNPRYFDYLDWLVGQINRHGMLAAMAPLWADMAEVHPAPRHQGKTIREEDAMRIARYVGGRYAGHHVLWIVGGDQTYRTSRQKEFWSRFASQLRDASALRQLTTVHPAGGSASYEFFGDEAPWLDLHMYQSSHSADASFTWLAAEKGFQLNPPRPVVNGEPVYEDIFNQFWTRNDTSGTDKFRIQPIHVRRAVIESLLSGALGGVAYGANGVWQWSTAEIPGSHYPRTTVLGALRFPGAEQIGRVAALMQEVEWHRLHPARYRIREANTEGNIPVAEHNRIILVYLKEPVWWVNIELPDALVHAEWYNPETGERTDAPSGADDHVVLVKPGWKDALWIGHLPDFARLETATHTDQCLFASMLPNPATGSRILHIGIQADAQLSLAIHDVSGRLAWRHRRDVSAGTTQWPIEVPLAAGVYFYRLEADTPACRSSLTGSFVETGF